MMTILNLNLTFIYTVTGQFELYLDGFKKKIQSIKFYLFLLHLTKLNRCQNTDWVPKSN